MISYSENVFMIQCLEHLYFARDFVSFLLRRQYVEIDLFNVTEIKRDGIESAWNWKGIGLGLNLKVDLNVNLNWMMMIESME